MTDSLHESFPGADQLEHADASFPELPDEPTDDAASDEPAAGTATRTRRAGGSDNRALIKKVAAKAEEINKASAENRRLLQHVLGTSSNSIADLTVAVMTADRSALRVTTSIKAIGDAEDAFDAAVVAASLEKNDLKAVWSLLSELHAVSGPMPPADAKAAAATARAVLKLTDADLKKLESAAALGRRS